MWTSVYKIYTSRLHKVAKYLSEHNGYFIFGSDTPAMNMFTDPPGYHGYLKMKYMSKAGISLHKTFRTSTYNNAKTFYVEAFYNGV